MIIFVHGWGMGPQIWDEVRARLPDSGVALDLGYGGAPMAVPGRERFVGVGHSFGLLWLLHGMADRLDGLIGINGFARFATPPRVLARMQGQFARAPLPTLNAFRARCALPPWVGARDDTRLAEHLDALAEWDQRATLNRLTVPFLSLSAADDPICPPGQGATRAGAAEHVSAEGGHVLPLTRPDWCAEQLRAVLP